MMKQESILSLLLIQDTDVFTNFNFSSLDKNLLSVFFDFSVFAKNFLGEN